MMMIDCISRLVAGSAEQYNVSAEFETFHDNLLEYPQYTRPKIFMGKKGARISCFPATHANGEVARGTVHYPNVKELAGLLEGCGPCRRRSRSFSTNC